VPVGCVGHRALRVLDVDGEGGGPSAQAAAVRRYDRRGRRVITPSG
jgi:hypothetical protein